MDTPEDTQLGRYRRSYVIDVVDSTEILIGRATLELKLRDLESAGAASKYEDIVPWVVSALTLLVSAVPLYVSSQDG